MKNIFIFQHWYYVIIILLYVFFYIYIRYFLFLLQCTQFIVYINRFCERYNRKYVSADHILRQKYVSFWQGERRKKVKKYQNPKVFSPKNKRGCHKKIFPETEKKNNIYHLCTLQRLYVWKYYVPEMSKPWIFWLKNSKYLCTKCEHFSVQCEL